MKAVANPRLAQRRVVQGLLLAVAAGLVGCSPPAAQEAQGTGEGTGEEALAKLVEVVELNGSDFQETIELYGETEPIRVAEVSAQVGGRITELTLHDGDRVEQGDTVLRLNASQGRAQIDRLEVSIEQLDTEIDRTERLIERGLATQSALEQLEAQRDATRESINEIRVGIRETRHQAPISGIVTETYEEEGEFVGQGTAVARIVDISTIVVRVGVPERDIRYVRLGQEIEVTIEATDQHVTGIVREIGVEANRRNRTFPVEVHVDNSDELLRAGMRARAVLPKRSFDDIVIIPRDAVVQALEGAEVYVVEDGIARAREVRLGPGRGRYVVVERGLGEGETLVVRGQRALVQGERVEVSRSTECCTEQYHRYIHGDPEDDAPAAPETSDNSLEAPEN
ncbi:MAG: efflux RND transporter periplasmic adaptor subunit [Myxococcales bacterium]|nr:efflux RND transporter periplasmic adaptor subunit [Myxococcales bacterium]